jgi:hypothetical protein
MSTFSFGIDVGINSHYNSFSTNEISDSAFSSASTGISVYPDDMNNIFLYNGLNHDSEGSVQIWDDGIDSIFYGNFFSDNNPWHSYYYLNGSSGNMDPHTSSKVLHAVGLNLLSPTRGEVVSGDYLVQWSTMYNSFNAPVRFSVLLASNTGPTVRLVDDLEMYEYVFNTSLFNDARDYRMIITAELDLGSDYNVTFSVGTLGLFTIYNQQISPPEFVNPLENDILIGIIDLEWSASNSIYMDGIYDLLLAPETTSVFVDIATGISETSYTWDTTPISNGLYFLKVVSTVNGENTGSDTITIEIDNPTSDTTTVITSTMTTTSSPTTTTDSQTTTSEPITESETTGSIEGPSVDLPLSAVFLLAFPLMFGITRRRKWKS